MRQTLRKIPEVQQKEKKYKQPEKVVDIGEEEYQGVEELDTKEIEHVSHFPVYIPPWKGKTKVTKDLDSRKFLVLTPLLLEQVEFEGTTLAWIAMLKMEDWDLTNHERFPHFATKKYMMKIYYEETRVTQLELMKWVRGVE